MNGRAISWRLRAALLSGVSCLAAGTALAQTPPPAQATRTQEEPTATLDEVVVVGSYLPGASNAGPTALTIVDQTAIETLGLDTTSEIVQSLALSGGADFNETNDGPNDARGDVATVNLRGLGPGNTLTLLNGRRLTVHPSDQAINDVPVQVVNVNTIPSAAIERIEVLRDGASALYGADATAGVVNFVLDKNYEGLRVTSRYGWAENTDADEFSLNLSGGRNFNDGRTNLSIFANWFDRTGYRASEQERTTSVDNRRLLPPDWAGDRQFDGRSSRSPWGEFQAGLLGSDGSFSGRRVRQGSRSLTTSSGSGRGRFHIQPSGFPPPESNPQVTNGAELDSGSLDRDLYHNFNDTRQISPDSQRFNVFTMLRHEFRDDLEFFGQLGYYSADSFTSRSAINIDPGLGNIIVPRTNYWNPFGPVGSPNRLPGLNPADVPADGLDVLIRRYRSLELGPRTVQVDSETLLGLAGLRGRAGDWDWETAVNYSAASNTDVEANRLSKTLFLRQLSLSTPDAYNPFGGPNANPESVLGAVRIDTTRRAESALLSWDIRFVNDGLFTLPGGQVGVAAGVEVRNESYEDDRDPRLDGTIVFSPTDASDVVGVSPTRDSSGERTVYGAFTEFRVPIVGPDNALPFVDALDLQLAGRVEYLDDIEQGVFTPKAAMAWTVTDGLIVRASYAEGFQAPGLVQLNQGEVSRLNTDQVDFWRSEVTNLPEDTGAEFRRSLRIGNRDLDPQNSRSTVLGVVFQPRFLPGFTASLDYWTFEQEGIIDNFGVENSIALDFLLRKQGGSNPNVVRAAVTSDDTDAFADWNAANPNDQRQAAGEILYVIDPYINLDPRTTRGLDFVANYKSPRTRFGTFEALVEAIYYLQYDQENGVNTLLNEQLNSAGLSPEEVAAIQNEIGAAIDPNRLENNGNPLWKGTASLDWRNGNWGAGFSAEYVSGFDDTSARNDVTDEFWRVDEWLIANVSVDYRFDRGPLDDTRLRFGVRNVTDEAPPLADESLSYDTAYHNFKGRFYYVQIRKDF